MLIDPKTCLACGALCTSYLLIDRHGRPYDKCAACGTRAFYPNFSPCLNGIALFEPIARTIVEEMARDKMAHARARERIATFHSLLQARMRSDGASPNTDPALVVASAADINQERSK